MGADDDLDAVAARLYALPPEDFTAARDDAAKQAGDRQLRAAVKALRRPTVSAWLVNVLTQRQPDLLDQVLALGPALAQAQAEGSGDALRQLGQQRRELVAAVTGTAVDLAGRDVTAAARTEVEQTLEAALADLATADAVRSGRLVRALSYAGFGGGDLDGAVATPARRTAPASKAAQKADGLEQAALAAAAALDDAVRACETAERDRETSRELAEAAEAGVAAAADELARLEAELAKARQGAAAASKAASAAAQRVRAADTAAQRARDAVSTAQQQAERARTALDRARRG